MNVLNPFLPISRSGGEKSGLVLGKIPTSKKGRTRGKGKKKKKSKMFAPRRKEGNALPKHIEPTVLKGGRGEGTKAI